MKIAFVASAVLAAATLGASAANAGTVTSAVGEFGPLPVTDAATSYATRTLGVNKGVTDVNTASTSTTFIDDFLLTVGPSLGETTAPNYYTSLSGNFFNIPASKSYISSFDVTLYQGTPGSGTELATTGVEVLNTNGSFSYDLEDPTLKAGTQYYLEADVVVPGKDSGHYGLTAITAPVAVPEPSTWALLIAGVAMLGGMLRLGRRREWSPTVA